MEIKEEHRKYFGLLLLFGILGISYYFVGIAVIWYVQTFFLRFIAMGFTGAIIHTCLEKYCAPLKIAYVIIGYAIGLCIGYILSMYFGILYSIFIITLYVFRDKIIGKKKD